LNLLKLNVTIANVAWEPLSYMVQCLYFTASGTFHCSAYAFVRYEWWIISPLYFVCI